MSFAHPLLLASGLAAIALPILIHILMRRRRRPMRWAAMRFLLEAHKRQRQRVRFEQILLLLARCLIVLLAALAIARPMVPGADPLLGSRATTLYLLIDNSLTAAHSTPSALEAHKQAAYDLLDRLDASRGDRAALYALASPAQPLIAPPSTSLTPLTAQIADLAPADSPADLHAALAHVAAEISQNNAAGGRSLVVVLSEFRAGGAPIDRPLPTLIEPSPTAAEVVLAATPPSVDPIANIAITALEPVRPIMLEGVDASTVLIRVRAARYGPSLATAATVPVQLFLRRGTAVVPIADGVLSFDAGSPETSGAIGIEPSRLGDPRREGPAPIVIEARIPPTDVLWRDNTRLSVIDRRDSLEIGLIAPPRFGPRPSVAQFRPGDWVATALDPEDLRDGARIRVRPIPPGAVDASTLGGLQGVVVAEPQGLSKDAWAALRRFADLGGLVVLFPQSGEGAQVWTDDARAALDLPWDLPREPVALTDAAPARPENVPPLLALIEGELAELLRPIAIDRAMPPTIRDPTGVQVLLTLPDQRPLIVAATPSQSAAATTASTPHARGLIVYAGVAMDLAWSDLPTKPLLLPLLQEIIRQGVAAARGNWVVLAGDTPVASPGSVELRWQTPPATPPGAASVIPLHPSAVARQPVRHAGLLRAVDPAGADRGVIAVNPDTSASNTTPRTREEIGAWLRTTGLPAPLWLDDERTLARSAASPGAGDSRRDWPLLPTLFALALALAVLEAIAARAFSHASRADARPARSSLAPADA